MSKERDELSKIIVRWCVANGEEFFPNPLADEIIAAGFRKYSIPEIGANKDGRL